MLFATAGMVMVAHATHMVSLLIGIETMSLAAYVLTGCWRKSLRSTEGAMKYFLMGAFATGFLVYGIALVYGTTGGEMSYSGHRRQGRNGGQGAAVLPGRVLHPRRAGVQGRGGAVPHVGARRVRRRAHAGHRLHGGGREGGGVRRHRARCSGTAFASPVLSSTSPGWANVLVAGAAITMTLGNLAALRQENVKRMLAYSSIAHAGYLLVGVVALRARRRRARKPALLFYLLAYTFTTLGAFGVVAWIGNRKDERLFVDDWAGVGAERPGVALAMTLFLLSLGGVPPTGGFFGKFYLFKAAMEISAALLAGRDRAC